MLRFARRFSTYALASVVSLSMVALAAGCAQGSSDPGVSADKCRLRDCGPSSGGGDGTVDEPDFGVDDTSTPFLDSGKPKDSGGGGGDTTAGDDTGVPPLDDTGVVGVDTGPTTCTPPAGKVCGTLPQCGCTGGKNCDVTKVDGTTSCVAGGTISKNGKCTKIGECAVGFSCVAGLCLPFCNSASDCSGSGSPRCQAVMYTPTGSTTSKPIPGFNVCEQQCDPVSPSSVCGSGVGCALVSSTGDTTCLAAGSATGPGACTSDVFACAPGYTCVPAAAPSTGSDCLKWCRIGFPSDCSGAYPTCYGFTDHPKIGGTEYGVCFAP